MSFHLGDPVRYKPGLGTYGYEDVLEPDGRLPGIVVGFTRTRVTVALSYQRLGRPQTLRKSVDAKSLTTDDRSTRSGVSDRVSPETTQRRDR